MIVFDTDVISDLMRPRPSSALVARLSAASSGEQCTTAITVGELSFGAHRVDRPDLFVRAMELLTGTRVLPFDEGAAQRYGAVRSELERAGARLADPDLRIASIVLVNDATLVSGNTRHFERVPELVVENWFRD